ncbi:hypothetical protein FB645_001550 [Coemansia sp. IMI 203386]|nr:hypothetical protein FB645_001550 [Coemansia sp. IMI 203386]
MQQPISENSTWVQRMRRRWSIQRQKRQPENDSNDQKSKEPSLELLTSHDAMSIEALPAYTARTHSEPTQIYTLSNNNVSLGDVRVFRVGRDVPESRQRHYTVSNTSVGNRAYSYYYQNDPLLYTYERREISEDAVPYLDDCDYEILAAQIARQQSLLRRNLHRMSMMLGRRPAGMP